VPGSAIYDVDAEAVVQNIAQCLKVGGLDDLHHPSEIVHKPPPCLPKIGRPEADTEQGAAIDRGSAFPQPYLDAVPAVGATAEIGGAGHACAFPEGAGEGDTSGRDVSPSDSHFRSGQNIEIT
jgi:hypothetical protein